MTEVDLKKAKKIAEGVAVEVGKLLQENIDKVKEVRKKGARDFVTNLDVEAEEMIISAIEKEFSDHSIVGEEGDVKDKGSDYTWVIDPLDGTMNYIHAHPPFRVGIGLLYKNKPVLSVLYNPVKGNLYSAIKGHGATLNGKKIETTKHLSLSESLVMTHLSSKKTPRLRTILALENIFNNAMQIRIMGSGLASMSYVAHGKYDVFFNVSTSVWDIIPAVCLIEEAGGKVTDIDGNEITLASTSVLATNGRVHKKMLELLENV
jgi:myo-inositol-1(or 4)-monophosphatase